MSPRPTRFLPIVCSLLCIAAAPGHSSIIETGATTDVSKSTILGLSLNMPVEDIAGALERATGERRDVQPHATPCADERHAYYSSGDGSKKTSCFDVIVLEGKQYLAIELMEDLPAHPHRSVIAKIQYEISGIDNDASRAAYVNALLEKYGKPDQQYGDILTWGWHRFVKGELRVGPSGPLLESRDHFSLTLSDEVAVERRQKAAEKAAEDALPTAKPRF